MGKAPPRMPQPGELIERYNMRRMGSAMSDNECSRPQYFHGNNRGVAKKRVQFTHGGKEYDVMTPVPPRLEDIAEEFGIELPRSTRHVEDVMNEKINRAAWKL